MSTEQSSSSNHSRQPTNEELIVHRFSEFGSQLAGNLPPDIEPCEMSEWDLWWNSMGEDAWQAAKSHRAEQGTKSSVGIDRVILELDLDKSTGTANVEAVIRYPHINDHYDDMGVPLRYTRLAISGKWPRAKISEGQSSSQETSNTQPTTPSTTLSQTQDSGFTVKRLSYVP